MVAKDDYFNKMFKSLVEYKKVHGHVDVPSHNKKDKTLAALGHWCYRIRRNYRTKRQAIADEKEQVDNDATGKKKKKKKKVGYGHLSSEHGCSGLYSRFTSLLMHVSLHDAQLLTSIGFEWEKNSKEVSSPVQTEKSDQPSCDEEESSDGELC